MEFEPYVAVSIVAGVAVGFCFVTGLTRQSTRFGQRSLNSEGSVARKARHAEVRHLAAHAEQQEP
jgi:hypothetical protein